MKKIILGFALMSAISGYSQGLDFGSILEGGVGDATNLSKGFLEPLAVGFGQGINGGWYSTAKTHKSFGIDIKIIASGALVPEERETFTFRDVDYDNIKLANAGFNGETQIPTIFGSKALADRPLLEFTTAAGSASASALPGFGATVEKNIGYNVVPSAMVQVGIGLFKNTDVKVRFIPEQSTEDFEFSTFGIGVMHDIKQWIPGIKLLPFHLSAFGGYTKIKSKVFTDFDTGQAIELNTNSYVYQLVASKKLAFLTVFGGIGTTSYSTDLNVLGNYTTPSGTPIAENPPIAINYEGSNLRANIGLDIKLLFLNVSAEYAKQEYDTFTLTAGFSIR